MTTASNKLAKLRNEIDKIDTDLLRLLSKRTEYVEKVGELKRITGENSSFIRPGREAVMLKKLSRQGAGKFPVPAIQSIWRSIISASLAVENGLNIAVLRNYDFDTSREISGYFGSFSKYIICSSSDEILDKINKNTIGVVDLSGKWWAKLSNEKYSKIKVFAAPGKNLYAIAKIATEKTGEDKTLVVTKSPLKLGKKLARLRSYNLYKVDGFHAKIKDGIVIGHYSA